jgi:CBS domain-containing protein
MLARDIMSAPVFAVGPDTPVPEIAALLARERISGVPVLAEGRLVGVVNEMDLLHRHEIGTDQVAADEPWWMRWFLADKTPMQYVKAHALKARDIMTRKVASVEDDAALAAVAALFDSRKIRRVLVVRAGDLVGIITRADLVRALAASAPQARPEGPQSDDEIRRQLLAELEKQRWWRHEWASVTVTNGVVQFRGVIDSDDEKLAARVAAENVRGVKAVEDLRERYVDTFGAT